MKKTISILIFLSLLLSFAFSVTALEAPNYPGVELSNDWDDNLMVTGYSGTNPVVTFPEKAFGKDVTRIDKKAFYKNTVVEYVEMNDNMTNLREWGMRACPNLKSVKFSKGLKVIEKYALAYNPSLKCALLRDTSIYSLDVGCFTNCTSLEYVSLPETLITSDNMLFENTSVRIVTFPASVEKIGNRTFADCKQLEKVYIPNADTELGEDVFLRAVNVTVYTVKNSKAQEYCEANGVNYQILGAEEFPSDVLGDVNNDGKISIRDVTAIQLALVGKTTEIFTNNCDYNKDGKFNINDATLIQRASLMNQ